MNFDPVGLFKLLQDHKVDFVVIGGIAAAIHGSPSVTQDLDVCYSLGPENLEKLAAALKAGEAKLRGAPDDLPFQLDAATLLAGDHFTFSTKFGDFAILGNPVGSGGYDGLKSTAQLVDLEDIEVPVASLDSLMQMKRASGRAKELYELEILGALRDEIEKRL